MSYIWIILCCHHFWKMDCVYKHGTENLFQILILYHIVFLGWFGFKEKIKAIGFDDTEVPKLFNS